MAGSENSYDVIAKHYDAAYASKLDLVDLPFYLELARQSRGPVLEIGCGTGRVLLPIARHKIEIHGVDNSAAMLRILKSHLASEPLDVRKKVHLHKGDMRSFRLKKKFPLVILPFRPLQHMFTLKDQLAALKTAAFHLGRRGTLAFDVFYPKMDVISSGIGEEIKELEWSEGGEPERVVRRFFRKDAVDKIHQNFNFTFIFRTYEGDQLVREESEPFALSYYTHPHLQALFQMADLEIVKEYGSFLKTPLDNSADQMIFHLRRARKS
ncbi:MAG TPA: class I SAM-dependent methyltransferase [Candidatus Limnocylindria bacterium]|nr:class I SAM-dependent methyltransferase [Candidatus Limnocylindria bacterium]